MSGDGEDYSQDEMDEVYDALGDAFDLGDVFSMSEVQKGITVTAKIEWAGEYANNGRDGERTVRLDSMNLTPVRDALLNARRLEGLAARGPLRSYTAKGWEAQLHHLNSTKRGREALRDAGWNPSRETQRRYSRGEQTPLKSNRAKLQEAYDNARNPGRGWVEARNNAVGQLTSTLREKYGSNIRFRDIIDFRLT